MGKPLYEVSSRSRVSRYRLCRDLSVITGLCMTCAALNSSISILQHRDMFHTADRDAMPVVELSDQRGLSYDHRKWPKRLGSRKIMSSISRKRSCGYYGIRRGKSRETITECMRLFNCQSVKNVADKRMRSFKQKYSASSNSFCKLFTEMFAGRLFVL